MIKLVGFDEHFLPWTVVKPNGIDGYHFTSAHIDVSGNHKWGGHRAIIAHYAKNETPDNSDQNTTVDLLYILVGDYWKIGNLRGVDDTARASRFSVFKLLLEKVESGIDPEDLYQAIFKVGI